LKVIHNRFYKLFKGINGVFFLVGIELVILLSDLILAVKTLNFLERKAILGKVEEGRIAKIDSLKGN
jgi:hypothetical protein